MIDTTPRCCSCEQPLTTDTRVCRACDAEYCGECWREAGGCDRGHTIFQEMGARLG